MRHLLYILAVILTLGAPVAAQSPEADADIATSLREVLQELGGYEDVTVTVNEGVVTFRGTANSLTEAEALEDLATRVEGVLTVRNLVTETADIGRRLDPALERFMGRVNQLVVSLPLLLIAGAVFAAILTLGVLVARLRQPWDRPGSECLHRRYRPPGDPHRLWRHRPGGRAGHPERHRAGWGPSWARRG